MSHQGRRQTDQKKKKPNESRSSKLIPPKSELSRSKQSADASGVAHDHHAAEPPRSLEAMMNDIQRRQQQYDHVQMSVANDGDDATGELDDVHEKSRKTFYREFKKVVDASDVIIEVLDARDPLGCRCPQVEDAVLTSGKNKKLILLLNKIDLIPRDNLDRWLKYLRNEFPTIAFRASTQTQRDRLGRSNVPFKACDEHLMKSSSKCIGASMLMSLLSNYCRRNEITTSITVGVVGYPNVGKSSVINSLKRSQACETGSMPGVTKQMQTIKLDKLIKLFDSPGIVMSRETDPASLVLRNCVRIETVDNPIPAIELLFQRCSKEQILRKYNLTDFQNVQDFLSSMAMKMGTLRKGGEPDLHRAAQRVLSDWNNGKLTYFTEPPERTQDIISTALVTEMRQAFDIDALLDHEEDSEDDMATSMQEDQSVDRHESTVNLSGDNRQAIDDEHPSTAAQSNRASGTARIPDQVRRRLNQQTFELNDKLYEDEVQQREFEKSRKHPKQTDESVESLDDEFRSILGLTPQSAVGEGGDD